MRTEEEKKETREESEREGGNEGGYCKRMQKPRAEQGLEGQGGRNFTVYLLYQRRLVTPSMGQCG